MTAPPSVPPPGAPFEVAIVLTAITAGFVRTRQGGDDWMPMLLAADDPGAPAMLVPFINTETADDRADVLWSCVVVWPLRGARRVLFVTDAFVRTYDAEAGDTFDPDAPSPKDDARAVECMQVVYADRPPGRPASEPADVWLGAFPYGWEEDGSFHWLPGPGWLPAVMGLSRMEMAVTAATVTDAELLAAVRLN